MKTLDFSNFGIIAERINLPEEHVMGPTVAVGKKVKGSWPKPGQLSREELVFENEFCSADPL